ncbi:MAG: hypothetical protein NZ749_13505 [bacterium]|nr:hypothetical protein [bacterium]
MKQDSIEVIHTVGYLASSLDGGERVGIVRQYWGKDSIRFDVGETTGIVMPNGRLLYIDHSRRRAEWLRAENLSSESDRSLFLGTNVDAVLSELRRWLQERGVVLGSRPTHFHTIYLGIPCTVLTYYDAHRFPVLTVYQPKQRGGPGLLKLCLVVEKGIRAVFAWDTVEYAKVKVSPSVFAVPSGYTISEVRS